MTMHHVYYTCVCVCIIYMQCIHTHLILLTVCFIYSYLKTLLVSFNEETNKFIEQLKPLTDGVTSVPMKVHFGDFVLNVISKVNTLANAMVYNKEIEIGITSS